MPQSSPFRMESRKRLLLLVAFVFLLSVLTGCTGGKKPSVDPTPVAREVPQDSLRAKFLLTITAGGEAQNLDAVLFSVPGKRYRMELTGPMGVGVASMLWQEDGWTMTFPTEKLYMDGAGYMVGLLANDDLPMVHIHQVAGLFEGKLLPEKYDLLDSAVLQPEQPSDPVVVVYMAKEKNGNPFSFARKGDDIIWLERRGTGGKKETLSFTEFKTFEGWNIPSNIVFTRDGVRYLSITIKKIARNKPFSLGTWRLNVPRSFKKIGM